MRYLLDTSVVVGWERAGFDVESFPRNPEDTYSLSVITISELLVGVHEADSESRKQKRANFVQKILEGFEVIEFSISVVPTHARLVAELRSMGKMIPANDLLIAATAIHHDMTLKTSDIKDFGRVPNLKIVIVHPRPSSKAP